MTNWWLVRCTRCTWGNTRKGTEVEVKRFGCPKCNASVSASPGGAPPQSGYGQRTPLERV